MPYDDPILKEFIGYFKAEEPDKRKIEELTEKKEERKVVRKKLSENI